MLDEAALTEWVNRTNEIVEELIAKDPALPAITAHIMAGDIYSREQALKRFRNGEVEAWGAVTLCGSYSRLGLAVELAEEGHIPEDELLKEWPRLWRGADPDDTDPKFLKWWYKAFAKAKGLVTDEGKKLPKVITVYRGQPTDAPLGCAWSLKRDIAEKFARGAWARTAVRDGAIFQLTVPRGMALAYITGRGEEEVIIDPSLLEKTGEHEVPDKEGAGPDTGR